MLPASTTRADSVPVGYIVRCESCLRPGRQAIEGYQDDLPPLEPRHLSPGPHARRLSQNNGDSGWPRNTALPCGEPNRGGDTTEGHTIGVPSPCGRERYNSKCLVRLLRNHDKAGEVGMTAGKTLFARCGPCRCRQASLPAGPTAHSRMEASRSCAPCRACCRMPVTPRLLKATIRNPFLPHHPLGAHILWAEAITFLPLPPMATNTSKTQVPSGLCRPVGS